MTSDPPAVLPGEREAGRSVVLVLGGARSGKTAHAERLALSLAVADRRPVYVATGQAFDDEMASRIARHRDDRGARFETIEAPTDLAGAVAAAGDGAPVLIDCLTLWLSNLMLADRDLAAATAALVEAIDRTRGTLILVSNEVGLGIVPDNALARRFRDEAGRLNQTIATRADRVDFVVAGLPLRVK